MSNPEEPDQPTLPGMSRRPAVRRPGLEADRRAKVAELEAAAKLQAEPQADAAHRCRPPYDDTARGFVGLPHSKTTTSKAAAEGVLLKSGRQRNKVYEYVHSLGGKGATVDEVSVALELPTNSVTPRFWELRKLALLEKVNETRPTRYGSPARVHVAAEFIGNRNYGPEGWTRSR